MKGLGLLLSEPAIAKRSCADCQKFVYIEDGPDAGNILHRRGEPVLRGSAPTPCWRCPKGSPENEWMFQLVPANLIILEDYWRTRATFGRYLGNDVSELTARMLAICDRMISAHDSMSSATILAQLLAQAHA